MRCILINFYDLFWIASLTLFCLGCLPPNFRYRRFFNSFFKMKKMFCLLEIYFFSMFKPFTFKGFRAFDFKTIFRVYLTKKNKQKCKKKPKKNCVQYNKLQNLNWFIVTLFILNENIVLLKIANQHPDMQIRQFLYSPHNVCPRMLMSKYLLAIMMLRWLIKIPAKLLLMLMYVSEVCLFVFLLYSELPLSLAPVFVFSHSSFYTFRCNHIHYKKLLIF